MVRPFLYTQEAEEEEEEEDDDDDDALAGVASFLKSGGTQDSLRSDYNRMCDSWQDPY